MVKTLLSNVSNVGLISGGGTKIPHARWYGQKKKKNKYPELKKEFHSNKGVKYNTSYNYDLKIKYGRQAIILVNLVILNFLNIKLIP